MTRNARITQVRSAARSAARAQADVRRNADRIPRQATTGAYVPPAGARMARAARDNLWRGR